KDATRCVAAMACSRYRCIQCHLAVYQQIRALIADIDDHFDASCAGPREQFFIHAWRILRQPLRGHLHDSGRAWCFCPKLGPYLPLRYVASSDRSLSDKGEQRCCGDHFPKPSAFDFPLFENETKVSPWLPDG